MSEKIEITGHTGLLCLLGSPVAHSISPQMHNEACRLLGLDLKYLAFDVIYEPRETELLRMAREAGLDTFNGMYMLLYQGAAAFKLWTGQDMPVLAIKEKYFA